MRPPPAADVAGDRRMQPRPEALFQLGQAYANAGLQEGKTYLKKYIDLSAKLPEDQRDPQKVQLAKQLIRALDVVQSLK